MNRGTIIAYHGVGTLPPDEDPFELLVPEETFEAQMDFLARRRNVVPLTALVQGLARSSKPAVAITFDDAYRSVLETASPILARLGLPSTVFVPTKWIGLRNEWITPSSSWLDIMDRDEIVEADRRGILAESHGHAHINYEQADPEDIEADVRASVDRLTEVLGRPPRYLAYPFGPTSGAACRIVEECGLEAAFTLERPHEGRFAYERVWIRPRHGVGVFALKTSGRWSASWRWSRAGRLGAAILRPIVGRRRTPRGRSGGSSPRED